MRQYHDVILVTKNNADVYLAHNGAPTIEVGKAMSFEGFNSASEFLNNNKELAIDYAPFQRTMIIDD